jgi:hypothetical protein
MKRILAPILLLTLLFPSLALGETMDDLVVREGLHYKKFTDVPFTGKVTGKTQGTFKNGRKHGPWVSFYKNGQLWSKGTYKNGKLHGPSVFYHDNGQFESKVTFLYGKRVQPSQYVADEVFHQIAQCWNIPGGIPRSKYRQVQIKIKLTRNGELKQKPEIINKSFYENDVYYRVQAESAIRSLENLKCTPFKLPLYLYELWKDITLTFDPRYMLSP